VSAAAPKADAAAGWQLTLPARTPYDRQLLMQTIRHTVTRWGAARVAIGRCRILVVGCPAVAGQRCPLCGRCPGTMHCRIAGRETCVGCALDTAPLERCPQATIGVNAVAPAGPHAGSTSAQRKPQQARRRNASVDPKVSSAN